MSFSLVMSLTAYTGMSFSLVMSLTASYVFFAGDVFDGVFLICLR